MNPEMTQLSLQLANTAVRNSATAVAERISSARTRKRDQETIAELEEIVNELVADKAELVRIAQPGSTGRLGSLAVVTHECPYVVGESGFSPARINNYEGHPLDASLSRLHRGI